MTDPVYRTILMFDIERFGRRDDIEQAFLRRVLYDVVDATLVAASVDETLCLRADRGDSVMELIDTRAPVASLLKALITEAPALLHNKNRLMADDTRMRLRVVLSSGYVAVDDLGGWVGSDLNHAVRLLNADALRDALGTRDKDSALCVSDSVYQGVVRHGPLGVRPEDFHRVTVATKEGPTVAWLYGDLAEPSVDDRDTDDERTNGTAGRTGANTALRRNDTRVGRDQYGMSGGTVHGDLNFGARVADRGDHR